MVCSINNLIYLLVSITFGNPFVGQFLISLVSR